MRHGLSGDRSPATAATLAALVVLHAIAAGCVASPASPVARLLRTVAREHQEIDIRTGRLRYSWHLWRIELDRVIVDSPLTAALLPSEAGGTSPEWELVNTFVPGSGVSPHYEFHGAIWQIGELTRIWELHGLPQDLRMKTAQHVTALWEYDRCDWLASEYVGALERLLAGGLTDRLGSVLRALPMPDVRERHGLVTRTVFFPDGTMMDRVRGRIGPGGAFIRDGVWERWSLDGRREAYGRYRNDVLHGMLFQWEESGKLSSIATYRRGELLTYEHEDLDRHPKYGQALRLGQEWQPAPHQ